MRGESVHEKEKAGFLHSLKSSSMTARERLKPFLAYGRDAKDQPKTNQGKPQPAIASGNGTEGGAGSVKPISRRGRVNRGTHRK